LLFFGFFCTGKLRVKSFHFQSTTWKEPTCFTNLPATDGTINVCCKEGALPTLSVLHLKCGIWRIDGVNSQESSVGEGK